MSPVLSNSAPVFSFRRRHAPPTSASLFPDSPDAHSPKTLAGELAPLHTGPGGLRSEASPADCPLPGPGAAGTRPANAAAGMSPGAQAPRASGFVLANPEATLVGIARLAASSPPAETRRKAESRPEYFLLPVKSILNRCDSTRVPFEWTINPYRGCEFGCKYCYARYTHEYMELDGSEFERKIFVKKDAAALLAHDVAQKYAFDAPQAEHIAIGTATDPYQPAEAEYGVTRACLEELAKREGLSISITTKSNQILRDVDLLKRIAEKSSLSLNITITTLRSRLARLLEPRAPRPDLRLAAVRQLRAEGLPVGVSAAPLLPGITDRDGELEELAAAAKEAGAQWFWSGVLFLMPASARQFLPFMREKFPRLARQYQQWYTRNGYAPEEYRRKISQRIARIKKELGFASQPFEEIRRKTMPCTQMSLDLTAMPSPAENSTLWAMC